jgi:hypothetical protein
MNAKMLDKYLPVLMHPAVSRAMLSPKTERSPALALLIRAREMRRDFKRSGYNAHEDAQAFGGRLPSDWYERGMTAPPDRSQANAVEVGIQRRLAEALTAEGLPDELRPVIERMFDGGARVDN